MILVRKPDDTVIRFSCCLDVRERGFQDHPWGEIADLVLVAVRRCVRASGGGQQLGERLGELAVVDAPVLVEVRLGEETLVDLPAETRVGDLVVGGAVTRDGEGVFEGRVERFELSLPKPPASWDDVGL
jgi:hypothetical protein